MDDLTLFLFLYLFLLLLLTTTTPPPTPTIPITNNSTLNYTINGDTITSPESFVNGSFTVHAIESSTLKNLSISADRLSSPPISVKQMNRNGDPGLDKSYAQVLKQGRTEKKSTCVNAQRRLVGKGLRLVGNGLRHVGMEDNPCTLDLSCELLNLSWNLQEQLEEEEDGGR